MRFIQIYRLLWSSARVRNEILTNHRRDIKTQGECRWTRQGWIYPMFDVIRHIFIPLQNQRNTTPRPTRIVQLSTNRNHMLSRPQMWKCLSMRKGSRKMRHIYISMMVYTFNSTTCTSKGYQSRKSISSNVNIHYVDVGYTVHKCILWNKIMH